MAFLATGAPSAGAAGACPNEAFRDGPSANLPDCRAYELVSPRDTNSATPLSPIRFGDNFNTPPAAPSGDSYLFRIEGTLLPGTDGGGFENEYRAMRGPDGWASSLVGPTGTQATNPNPGGATPEHGYQIFRISEPAEMSGGSLDLGVGHPVSYLRYPDGSFHLLGEGTLPANPDTDGYQNGLIDDPSAVANWIAPEASHIIFHTGNYPPHPAVQLLPDAPATGTAAVYDRTPTGLHVVSLLPGDLTPGPGERAVAMGTSADGTAVAFTLSEIKDNLYVRHNNVSTARVPDASIGETLTCVAGPGSATLSYEWLRNGAPLAGQTSPTYTTTSADEGAVLQCRVSAANSEGGSRTASFQKNVEPAGLTTPPGSAGASISGLTTVGSTLTCNPGPWTGSPSFAYQWLRNWAPIAGATGSTYSLTGADNETAIQCEVTGTNAEGAAVADSSGVVIRSQPPVNTGTLTNAPTITGTASVGETLTCANGVWTGASSFAYQWLRNGAEIAAATGSTYTLVAGDEGKAIQCRITASNAGGSGEATSANAVVAPAPSPLPPTRPSEEIWVSGTRGVGKTLTCYHEESWGNSPTEFVYQWLRNGAPIAGANSGPTPASQESYTYTTIAADLDKLIQCRVAATNAGGSSSATSPSTQENVIVIKPPSASASTGSVEKTYAGFSEDGSRLFYLERGDVFSFDTNTGAITRLTEVGDAKVANVSADGSHVYFVSHQKIGGQGSAGQPNLYVWDGSGIGFIATVEEADLLHSANYEYGLAFWAVGEPSRPAAGENFLTETSRTTPDGKAFAFETTAQLTPYDNAGHTEVYRYDTKAALGERLTCISCNPSGAPAESNAQLADSHFAEGIDVNSVIPSLTADGAGVFFESAEALVPGDSNGVTDVYEWRGGRISLISSGHSPLPSILTGMTPDGHDVFFQTNESLVPDGQVPGIGAIYDARVDGGLASQHQAPPAACSGDACQGEPGGSPNLTSPSSSTFTGRGNVKVSRHRKHRKRKHHHRVRKHRRAARVNRGGSK